MPTNQKSDRDRHEPSDPLYRVPAGRLAHKARFGASEVSKQPDENGNLPDKPGGFRDS